MKKKFINNSLKYLESKKTLTDLERKKLKYGLEGFYNLITKFIVLIIIAIIFNLLPELVLLTIIYGFLRLYGFGLHAKKTWQCWVTTLPIYIGGCFLIKYLTIPQVISNIVWLFGFISFALFAPADTKSRPLIHKEKRKRAKILSIIIVIALYIINIYLDNPIFLNASLYALLIQSFVMNPLIYKLFNAPYNNYKTYQNNMV